MMYYRKFLQDESGAITIEWVALAAGVIILALGVISVLTDPINGVATSIASTLETATDSLLSQALAETN